MKKIILGLFSLVFGLVFGMQGQVPDQQYGPQRLGPQEFITLVIQYTNTLLKDAQQHMQDARQLEAAKTCDELERVALQQAAKKRSEALKARQDAKNLKSAAQAARQEIKARRAQQQAQPRAGRQRVPSTGIQQAAPSRTSGLSVRTPTPLPTSASSLTL